MQLTYLRHFDEHAKKELESKPMNKKRKKREDQEVEVDGEPTKRQKLGDEESVEMKAK